MLPHPERVECEVLGRVTIDPVVLPSSLLEENQAKAPPFRPRPANVHSRIGQRQKGRPTSASDDVVDFEYFWLARVDTNLGEQRHEALSELLQLLAGVPDLTDPEIVFGTEGDMDVQAVWRPVPSLL